MLIGVLSALLCPKLGLQGGAGDPADHVALGLPVRHLGVPRDPGRDRAPVRVAVRVLWWDVLMLCLCCACAVCGLCIAPPTSPSGTRVNSMATSTLVWDQFHASNSSAPPPTHIHTPCDVLYFVPMRIECGCGCACDPTVCPIRRVCRVSQLNESAGISPIGQVRQLRHQFGRVTRLPQQYSIPPTCRVTCSAACQCSPGADWCLRSDVITDSRLQGLIGVLLSTCVAYNDNSNDRFSKQAILDTITKGVGYGTPSCLPISRTFPSSS